MCLIKSADNGLSREIKRFSCRFNVGKSLLFKPRSAKALYDAQQSQRVFCWGKLPLSVFISPVPSTLTMASFPFAGIMCGWGPLETIPELNRVVLTNH